MHNSSTITSAASSTFNSTNGIPSEEGQVVFKRPASPNAATSDVVMQTSTAAGTTAAPLFSPPRLTSPETLRAKDTCSEYRLIRMLDGMHESSQRILNSFTTSLQQGTEKLKELSRENIEKLRESAQRAKDSGFWSLLQKIGECILAAISTVLGITLIGTGAGAVVGGLMIAAGVLTITNLAMRETGSWDWVSKQLTQEKEKQEKIAFYLPLAVGFVAAALGFGASANSAAVLWSNLTQVQKALSIAQAALGISQGATTIGKGVTQAKVLWTRADLVKIDTEISLERIGFERNSSMLNQILKKIESAQQTAEQVISLAVQSLRKTSIQA